MRVAVEIERTLLKTAMRESGLRSSRAVIEEGLRVLIRRERRRKLRDSFGKYRWEGDLSDLRRWSEIR
jgi:Arc/MetJ family transcription regulator